MMLRTFKVNLARPGTAWVMPSDLVIVICYNTMGPFMRKPSSTTSAPQPLHCVRPVGRIAEPDWA